MTRSERRDALDQLEWSTYRKDQWKTISKWIRRMVRLEPTVMRKVAAREFGNLSYWIKWIKSGGDNVDVCGCLVGTVALQLVDDRDSFKVDSQAEAFVCEVPQPSCEIGDYLEAAEVVGALARYKAAFREDMVREADEAGMAAAGLGDVLGQALAVDLIKSEIQHQLYLRRQRIKRAK